MVPLVYKITLPQKQHTLANVKPSHMTLHWSCLISQPNSIRIAMRLCWTLIDVLMLMVLRLQMYQSSWSACSVSPKVDSTPADKVLTTKHYFKRDLSIPLNSNCACCFERLLTEAVYQPLLPPERLSWAALLLGFDRHNRWSFGAIKQSNALRSEMHNRFIQGHRCKNSKGQTDPALQGVNLESCIMCF